MREIAISLLRAIPGTAFVPRPESSGTTDTYQPGETLTRLMKKREACSQDARQSAAAARHSLSSCVHIVSSGLQATLAAHAFCPGLQALRTAGTALVTAAGQAGHAVHSEVGALHARRLSGPQAAAAIAEVCRAVESKDEAALARAPRLSFDVLAENYASVEPYLDRPLTVFDDDLVIATRKRLLQLGAALRQQPSSDTSRIDTRERVELRKSIEATVYGQGAERKERQVTFLVGQASVGKSTIAGWLERHQGALSISREVVREHVPEYQQHHLLYPVHTETTRMMKNVLDRAFAAGDNLVMSSVPVTPGGLEKKLADLAERKRKGEIDAVHLVYMDVDTATSVGRGLARQRDTGRPFDPYFNNTLTPDASLARDEVDGVLRHPELFDTFSVVDNNGDRPVVKETRSNRPGLAPPLQGVVDFRA